MAESNKQLFARGNESMIIEGLSVKANLGTPCLALLSGSFGTGKTTLIKNALHSVKQKQNIFLYSKFDALNQNVPYYAFTGLTRELIQYLLAAPKNEVNDNKDKIKKCIGNNKDIISNFIPELKYVYNETLRKNVALKNPMRYLEHAVFSLISQFATKDHPIVLFIDDFQWADDLSLNLLQYFCCNLNNENLFMICAFRDCPRMDALVEKIESIEKKNFYYSRIKMENLTFSQTFDFVSCYANHDDSISSLYKISTEIYKKTIGIPLYVSQMMDEYNEHQEMSSTITIPDDTIKNALKEMRTLPEETIKALIIASIIGLTFPLDVLSQVLCNKDKITLSLLKPAFAAGIILPSETCNQFEFVHECFKKELLRMADDDTQLHLTVAYILLHYYKNNSDTDLLIKTMAHFVYSAELIENDKDRIELAEYLSISGDALLHTRAYSEALKYYETGARFLNETTYDVSYKLKYEIFLGYATALFFNENYRKAEETFDIVLSIAKDDIDYLKTLKRKTTLYHLAGKQDLAVKTGIEALAKMGISIPINPSKAMISLEALKTKKLLQNKYLNRTQKEELNSSQTDMILDLMMTLAFSTVMVNPKLHFLLMMRLTTLSIKQEFDKYAPLAYTEYELITGCLKTDRAETNELKTLSKELIDQYEPDNNIAYLYHFSNTIFINYWLDDWHNNIQYYDTALNKSIKKERFLQTANTLEMKLIFLFCTGRNLNDLIAGATEAHNISINPNAKGFTSYFFLMNNIFQDIALLKTEFSNNDKEFINRNPALYYLLKMQIYFLCEKYEDSIEFVLASKKHEKNISGLCYYADIVFYQSLIITASGNSNKSTYKKILYNNQDRLHKWFKNCPENFGHKYYLVSAEIARVNNKPSQAIELYKKAILSAAKNGFTQNEAIASELTAKFLFSAVNWEDGEFYIYNAYNKFKQWGSPGKLDLLEQEYPFLATTIKVNSKAFIQKDEENHWDEKLADAVKMLNNADNPYIYLEGIMNTILKIGSAKKGHLLTEKADGLYVIYEKNNRAESGTIKNKVLSEYVNIPKKMIYYTSNTHEAIVQTQEQGNIFLSNDPYIANHPDLSHVTIPLIFHGSLIGVLHLEKESNSEKCSCECIEALKTLSYQVVLLQKLQDTMENNKDKNAEKKEIIGDLTPREKEILGYITSGDSNKEIADNLGLSVNTVKTHILSIYSKLNVKRRSQAVIIARDLNLFKYERYSNG